MRAASRCEPTEEDQHGLVECVPLSLRYDTRCYFNVSSNADISQLNLPHGTNNQKVENKEKLKSKKTDMLRSISKQSGESVESVLKKKRKATVGRILTKGRF